MPIEIEKKYRLSEKQRDEVLQRLPKIGAKRRGEEFEVNTLYAGETLDIGRSILRLRRVGNRGILTYKERFPTRAGVKHQREDETRVGDPDAMEMILETLGFTPALVYEKRRDTWTLGKTEIVIDELPLVCSWRLKVLSREFETSKANSQSNGCEPKWPPTRN